MEIIFVNGNAGVYSWADGFRSMSLEKSIDEEAKKNAEAVINRLLEQGRVEEATRILETYV